MRLQEQKSLGAKKIIFLCALTACMSMHPKEGGDEEAHQVRVGNFAVDGTMQPGPLLGFGQNIIDAQDALGIIYPTVLLGKQHKNFSVITPGLIYGIRDDFSLLVAFPTAIRLKLDGNHSSGSTDTLIQFEYAPWINHQPMFTNLISLVGSVYLPTGDECKNPATGFGSPSFFLGIIAEHLATEWYAYTSYGALLPTKNDVGVKPGNEFFYQFGFGKNIAYSPNKWILMWMLELSGTYEQRSKLNGVIEPNTGFNTVLVGPALWFSTQRFVLEFGVAPVVSEHLFGQQIGKNSVLISLYTAFRF